VSVLTRHRQLWPIFRAYFEGFIVGNFSGVPTCINAAAFSAEILRSNALPRWIGMAAALIHIITAGSLAAEGPLSPIGMIPQVAPGPLYPVGLGHQHRAGAIDLQA
jgi:hypothetical protein